jgi:hypothetical protein
MILKYCTYILLVTIMNKLTSYRIMYPKLVVHYLSAAVIPNLADMNYRIQ